MMNEARIHISPTVQRIMARVSPEKRATVERRMQIASRIDDLLTLKGWSQKEFAEKMGKRPSEVSKWLSGTHNFTLETITLIESHLGTKLLVVPDEMFVVN